MGCGGLTPDTLKACELNCLFAFEVLRMVFQGKLRLRLLPLARQADVFLIPVQ